MVMAIRKMADGLNLWLMFNDLIFIDAIITLPPPLLHYRRVIKSVIKSVKEELEKNQA